MTDLISRQAAIDAVMELIEAGYEWRSGVSRKISLLNAVYCALEDIPSAQPTVDAVSVEYLKRLPSAEPVRHGKWIYGNDFHWYTASCNKCGYQRKTDIKADGWNQWKFCPNCGARMDEE